MSVDEKNHTFERHTQTVLVLVLVALLLWVGATTQQTAIAVAEMSVEMEFLKQDMKVPTAKFVEIEKRLDNIETQLTIHMNGIANETRH